MIGEAHHPWSSQEKETHPSKRLIRIEDCHLEACTEWIGVMSEEGKGKKLVSIPYKVFCVVLSKIASSLISSSLEDIKEALVKTINKACHPEGHPSKFLI